MVVTSLDNSKVKKYRKLQEQIEKDKKKNTTKKPRKVKK